MASKASNYYSPTLKNLCVYWKIIGLCPFVIAEDGIGHISYWGIVWGSILTLSYVAIYFRAMISRVGVIMTRETPLIVVSDFLGLTLDSLMIIAAWIYVILRQNDLKKIFRLLKKVEKNSRTIDLGQDFHRFLLTLKLHTILMNLTWMTLCIGDHIFLYEIEKFKIDIWFPFHFPRFISHNILVIFVDVLWMMRNFFSSLNEKIRSLSREVTVSLVISEVNRSSLIIGSHRGSINLSPLEACGQMHSDLVTLTRMIVEFFSLSIMLMLLEHSTLMASDLYALGLMTLEQNFLSWRKILTFVDMFFWWWLHFIESAVLISISDSTASKANRTGTVLHTMLTMDPDKNYKHAAQVLSLRLLQSHLTIELYGFQLKLSVVHKIIGMVVTYVTIMMQIDIQDLQQRKMQMLELNTSQLS